MGDHWQPCLNRRLKAEAKIFLRATQNCWNQNRRKVMTWPQVVGWNASRPQHCRVFLFSEQAQCSHTKTGSKPAILDKNPIYYIFGKPVTWEVNTEVSNTRQLKNQTPGGHHVITSREALQQPIHLTSNAENFFNKNAANIFSTSSIVDVAATETSTDKRHTQGTTFLVLFVIFSHKPAYLHTCVTRARMWRPCQGLAKTPGINRDNWFQTFPSPFFHLFVSHSMQLTNDTRRRKLWTHTCDQVTFSL